MAKILLSERVVAASYVIVMNRKAKGVRPVHLETVSDQVQLNRRWRPALMAFFLRRVRDHAEAEDLTQEVFTRLLASDETMASSPDSYVFRVAANLLVDRARRARVRADWRDNELNVDGRGIEPLDPHRIAAGRAALAALLRHLDDLPERTRAIFILYRVENLTQEAIGEALGISASAAKQHIQKAMAFLMQRMRDDR